jgi:hypothetical protein
LTKVLHLPEGKAERRMLASTQRLDIPFEVDTDGLIIVVAAAGSWNDEPGELLPTPREGVRVPHRIELIPPDGATPEASVSDGGETHLVHQLLEAGEGRGRWTARLTNLGTRIEEFGLFVSYPSRRELQQADIAPDVFADLATLRLELHRGHQASSLSMETAAGPVTHFFTVPDIEYSCPWTPRVLVYFDDLRSTSVAVSVPAGLPDPVLRYELGFDEAGLELNGTIPLNLSDMRLTLDLPIIVQYYRMARSTTLSAIDYEEADVRATFSFEPRFDEVVEWFPGFFPRWRRLIQRTVEKACRDLLASAELRKLFSESIQARVLEQLGANAKPVGVAPADGKLRISYYTF